MRPAFLPLIMMALMLLPSEQMIASPRDELRAQLQSDDSAQRRQAARMLGDLRGSDAVVLLAIVVKDADIGVREEACQALGKIGGASVVDPLITALYDEAWEVREEAGRSLTKVGIPAIGSLVTVLSVDDWKIPMFAAEALRSIGAVAHPQLIEALRTGSWNARSRAADVLQTTGWKPTTIEDRVRLAAALKCWRECIEFGGAAVEPLIDAFEDAPPTIAAQAADALGKIGDARAVVPIIQALQTAPASVIIEAANAFKEIGDSRATEPLIGLLEHPDSNVRASVVRALGRLYDPRVEEPIRVLLADSVQAVRHEAEKVLLARGWEHPSTNRRVAFLLSEGKTKECAEYGAEALPAVFAALREKGSRERSRERSRALSVLRLLRDPACVEPLIGILADVHDPSARAAAAFALGAIQDSLAVEPLINALSSENELLRREVVGALAAMPSPRALDALAELLDDESHNIRSQAASVLSRNKWAPPTLTKEISYALAQWNSSRLEEIGPPVVERLIAILSDPRDHRMSDAIRVLGRIGDATAAPAILPFLTHRRGMIRAGAVEALGKLGEARAIPQFRLLLDDEDRLVRSNVARALRQVGWQPSTTADRIAFLGAQGEWANLAQMGQPGIARLMTAVRDERWYTSESDVRLVDALVGMGPAVVDSLIPLIEGKGGYARRRAASVLATIADQRAIEPFLRMVNTSGAQVDGAIIDGLGRMGDGRAVAPLLIIAGDLNSSNCSRALLALGELGDRRAVPVVIGVLSAERCSYRTRWTAISALAALGGPEAEAVLVSCVSDGDKKLTIHLVAECGARGMMGPLETALQHRSVSVRREAAAALDSLEWRPPDQRLAGYYYAAREEWDHCIEQGPDASEALLWALNDKKAVVILGSIEPIGRMGLRGAVPRLASLLEVSVRDHPWRRNRYGKGDGIRLQAIDALGGIDDDATIEPLLAALSALDRETRVRAVRALGRKGAAAATSLSMLHSDPDTAVTREVRVALAALGNMGVEPLSVWCRDEDRAVRLEAAVGLGFMKSTMGVDLLIDLLSDDSAPVRAAAAKSLGKIGDPRAKTLLQRARADDDLQVRIAATRALFDLRRISSSAARTGTSSPIRDGKEQ